MLTGTSCRFSVRLRAVTTTSSKVTSPGASTADAGATCMAAELDNVAAIARASLERDMAGVASA